MNFVEYDFRCTTDTGRQADLSGLAEAGLMESFAWQVG